MSKRRGERNPKSYTRKQNNRTLRKRFLIVCEGEKTEPFYFENFRVPREIIDIRGIGENTVSLVKKTIALSEKEDYDFVWVVLDRDSFPINNFNQALDLAKRNSIGVAYSNEAFELWYLLHFDFHQSAISRTSYQERLSVRLPFKYEKNNPKLHNILRPQIQTAIHHAERLLEQYGQNHLPVRDNPCTTVHLLVKVLLENEVPS